MRKGTIKVLSTLLSVTTVAAMLSACGSAATTATAEPATRTAKSAKTTESKTAQPRSATTLGVLLFHERMLKAFQGRIDQRELNQRRTLCRIML